MVVTDTQDRHELELALKPDGWPRTDARTRVLLVAINMPGYYSLPVRILSLLPTQNADLAAAFDVRFVETTNKDDLGPLRDCIRHWQPRIVGLSVNIWNLLKCKALAATIKQELPNTCILCGGQEMTNSVVDYLAQVPHFDYLVDGEGEIPFRQFLQAWTPEGLRTPARVSGLRYREGGKTVCAAPAEIVSSLDEVPSPALAGLIPVHQNNLLGVMLEGSRGCPFRCSFCFEGGKHAKVRTAALDRLMAEAQYMVARGARYFHLMDPILCNSDPERLRRLAAFFESLKRGHRGTVISVEAYAHHITPQVAEHLRSFSIIDLGLQTVNPETARAIHRTHDPQKTSAGVARLRGSSATVNLYLIYGLPHETAASFLDGVRFVLAQAPTRVFFNELLLLNGTELRRRAAEYAYDFDPDPPYRVRQSQWMSRREMKLVETVAKLVERRYNLRAHSVYLGAPWLTQTAGCDVTHAEADLPGTCGLGCPGCRLGQPAAHAESDDELRQIAAAKPAELDVVCGSKLPAKQATQLTADLLLAGVDRLRFVSAPALFADAELLEKLIELGLWHMTTFVRPADDLEESLRCLSNLGRAFKLRGHASVTPCVEVVVLPGGLGPGEYLDLIKRSADRPVRLITVPQELAGRGEAWSAALLEAFDLGLNAGWWLKLPRETLEKALGTMAGKAEICAHLEALGLVSHAPNHPPCYRPQPAAGANDAPERK